MSIELEKDQDLAEAALVGDFIFNALTIQHVNFILAFQPEHVKEYIAEVRRLRDWQKRAVEEMRKNVHYLPIASSGSIRMQQLIEEAK